MVAKPPKLLIPPRISALTARVSATVDFHNQAQSGSEKVSDERPYWHLAPKTHAEQAPTGKLQPEAALRDGGKLTKCMSALDEELCALTRW